MTEAEKRVFDEIFGDITKRRKQVGGVSVPGLAPTGIEFVGKPPGREKEIPAATDQDLTREMILMMYPPALRRAAEIALGLQEEEVIDDEFLVGERPSTDAVEAEEASEDLRKMEEAKVAERAALMALHREEKARVLGLMQQCRTDVELWGVLEEEVFSMVERLGIGNAKEEPEAARKETGEAKKKKKNKKNKKEVEPADRTIQFRESSLSMEQYGPLYSVHLLTGLRLLDRGFATPSPLALNVLPRVLELGMASYVLGVSTRFYNELISIYWYRYGDSDSVMRLLREMERAGMSGDSQTLRIINAVADSIEGLAEAEQRSPFAAVLSSMQEYDSIMVARLKRRRAWVLDSMREKAEELPF